MPGSSNEERLAEMFSQCAAEMLADLGAPATRLAGARQPQAAAERIAAFVSLGNAELHGSLTLLAPGKLFSRLHPVAQTTAPSDLNDWACEMVNQAVGRFRNRLASYAVKVVCGVPQIVPAGQVEFTPGHEPARSLISFALDDLVLDYLLEFVTEHDFWLAESPMEEIEKALKEGTLVLF
jgi:hypothetical protein